MRELENTIQRACALSNSDVLLPSDIPLGTNSQRYPGASSTVTRMRDALSTLLQAAQSSPDLELLPWVEKELSRLAFRHFEEDAAQAAKFLGSTATRVAALQSSSQPAPALKVATPAAAATKRASKKAI